MGASGLGNLLVQEGFLTEQDMNIIHKTTGQTSWAFARGVISTGLLHEDELASFLTERTKHEMASKDIISDAEPDAMASIDIHLMANLEIFPLEVTDSSLTIAMVDPLDKGTVRQIEFFTELQIKPKIATFSQIYEALKTVIPNYKPKSSELDNFMVNHASSALHKQKIEEGDSEELNELVSANLSTATSKQPADSEEDLFDGETDLLDGDEDLSGLEEGFSEDADDFEIEGDDLEDAFDISGEDEFTDIPERP